MTISRTISDLDIQALIDGELEKEDQRIVKERVMANPALKKRYFQLEKQKTLLKLWWKEH